MSVKITNAEELGRAIAEAYQSGDQAAQVTAWQGFCQALSDQVRQDAAAIGQQMDADALRQRGYRVLTQAEHKFWEKVIDAMNAPQPKQAFATIVGSTNGEDMMPTTILEDVYQDLQHSHPLLSAIGIEYTGYVIKWVLNNHTAAPAKYGSITDEITKEITSSFSVIDTHQNMLSCYAIVEKGMLDLGPVWLDGYVRTCMVEGMAQAMEKAAISGTGKDSPVGMDRDLSAAYTDASGYTQKTAVEVTSFDAASYGALVAKLATAANGQARNVMAHKLGLICNVKDYLTKVMPATTVLTPAGNYVNNVLPIPTEIFPTTELAEGKAILGLLDLYKFFAGSGPEGVIEYDDSVKFLQNQRAFRMVQYHTGRPLDNNCFILLDISKLEPLFWSVKQVAEASTAADSGSETPSNPSEGG